MRTSQVSAKILADSKANGVRITTFEIEYPRYILAELNTHRVFSRNSASSRAIPIEAVMEQVLNDPAMPMVWGLDQAGMQAKKTLNIWMSTTAVFLWRKAAKASVASAKLLQAIGLHKQIVNRVMEPFQRMKTVITSTEWNNFYYLRDHEAAQPEIAILAKLMQEQSKLSAVRPLFYGQWHVPYVRLKQSSEGWVPFRYEMPDGPDGAELNIPISWEEALKISASCCAQVSYRLLDESPEKAASIFKFLVDAKPVHASPFEHQATPMQVVNTVGTYINKTAPETWEKGITHMDRKGNFWSGNFQGWIQHRQLIDGHVMEG